MDSPERQATLCTGLRTKNNNKMNKNKKTENKKEEQQREVGRFYYTSLSSILMNLFTFPDFNVIIIQIGKAQNCGIIYIFILELNTIFCLYFGLSECLMMTLWLTHLSITLRSYGSVFTKCSWYPWQNALGIALNARPCSI